MRIHDSIALPVVARHGFAAGGLRLALPSVCLAVLCLGVVTTALAGPAGEPGPGGHQTTGERLAEQLRAGGLSSDAVVLIIAILPVVELRGAVPVGINLLGMPWHRVVFFAIVGNMLPVFLVLWLLDAVVRVLVRFRPFRRFFDWLFARTRRRSDLIRRWEFWGLAMFVAVPLPVTGAWTGSIASVLMGLPYWRSVLAIFVGVLVAGAIVTALSLLGTRGAVIAGVALLVLFLNGVLSGWRRRRRAGSQPPGTSN
ncbi:MAG: small multi-drug export protein [bacterium]